MNADGQAPDTTRQVACMMLVAFIIEQKHLYIPMLTKNPCAQQVGLVTSIISSITQCTLSKKAIDWKMSAIRRLIMRMMNWLYG